MKSLKGVIVDPLNREQYNGEIRFDNGRIITVTKSESAPDRYIMPGMVDSHIHIESSMLIPSEFARLAIKHGTVATVSDPHEIANVCGMEGVDYMIGNGRLVPLKFYFGAPSCVPATPFETAGAVLGLKEVEELLERDDIVYLAEMMNWPGVLNDDPEVTAKIRAALDKGKPVDGHAPGLKGEQARKYASAGITTDHECYTREEAIDKLEAGMLIAIREGSAAKNYDALIPLLEEYPERIMFCSDDKHPDDLVRGHINELVRRTRELGYDLFDTLHAASVLPVKHYNLDVGLLREGDPADFIVVDHPDSMRVKQTWIDGKLVYSDEKVHFPDVESIRINRFNTSEINAEELRLLSDRESHDVIVARDGELITGRDRVDLKVEGGEVLADPGRDILKIAVVNRYEKAKPVVGFIRNFGIQNGAIASSVAHDSHNIIAVGSDDESIARAINLIIKSKGGISAVHGDDEDLLPLPVGGIMSDQKGGVVAEGYERLTKLSRDMGSTLKAPFMLISFMALLVIPTLKISDKGLFDGETFEFVDR
ncbi:MAG: adenine deaminase [Balneolaceae bacterium]|nr:adenine deaminase [Balneolaceae bacterium]MCH8547392.1 adenine deaminase [Balneolaceae bacterium]